MSAAIAARLGETAPHQELLGSLRLRIVDRAVLALLKSWLQAPVQSEGPQGPSITGGKKTKMGTPQGGVISPLLANRYMNRYLRYWKQCTGDKWFAATLVNYADDFVILSKGRADQALAWTTQVMNKLKLEVNETKTCVRNARTERFDFLGYSFGLHHVQRSGRPYLGASASAKAVLRLKGKISEALRPQSGEWGREVRDKLNRMLVRWEAYFHYGSKRKTYRAWSAHARTTVRSFLQRRHKVFSRGTHHFTHGRSLRNGGCMNWVAADDAACR